MRKDSTAASCCLALMLIALCTLLSGCNSSLNAVDYDQVAKECGDKFLNSMPEGQHVFIDPQLSEHEYAPVTLRAVEQKLTQLEDKANGKVRFRVIAKQINQPAAPTLRKYKDAGLTAAQLLLPLMLEKAKRSDSFPNDNYVLVLLTRYNDDVQSTSIETTCSPELLAAYPTLEIRLTRGNTDNIQDKTQKFLPNPVDEAVLLVAREVTAEIATVEKAKSEQAETLLKAEEEKQRLAETEKKAQEERQLKASDATGPVAFVVGLLVGALLVLIGGAIFKNFQKGH